ncbi:DUF445 domain-containing protein [Paraburkholderia sp. B3]|uniref:DUF445 domain-containing protein n=1 Tax=Paraburkholderia sp. B3 TaxID=3134791 RepID=UPI00398263F6
MASVPPIDPAAPLPADERVVQLRRMRIVATALLLAMLLLFVAASAFESARPWLAYVRAFSEAAMVGACADWFAVVSLFRHPFGVALPHTAVIPRHKVRIGESFGRFVSSNFLAPAEVAARLEHVDAAGWATRWITEPANAKLVAQRLQGLFPSLLSLFGEHEVQSFSRGLIRNGIDSFAAAPLVARLLSVLVAHGHHEAAFDIAIDTARHFLDHHQDNIRQKVAKKSAGWVPGWLDERLTNAFLAELQSTMNEAREDAEHPWRVEYRDMLDTFMLRLADDPQLLEYGERIKSDVLDNGVVEGYLNWLGVEIEGKVRAELSASDGMLANYLEQALIAIGKWIDESADIRALINQSAQRMVFNAVVPNRQEIGAFVSEVVARWDTETLVKKLELQFGKDLQYIRVNGTLVGGLVGLGIFVAVRLLG